MSARRRKPALKTFVIPLAVYKTGVHVAIGDEGEGAAYCRKILGDAPEGLGEAGRCYTRSGYPPVIWLPGKPDTSDAAGDLAHEALHAALFLAESVGINVSCANSEPICYLVGYIVSEIIRRTF